jgi:hypothetical protein
LVKLAHDVAAVIAQLPLGDLLGHTDSVARVLRCPIHGANHLERQAWQGRRSLPALAGAADDAASRADRVRLHLVRGPLRDRPIGEIRL